MEYHHLKHDEELLWCKKEKAMASGAVMRYEIINVGMMGREHMLNLTRLIVEGAAVTCLADPYPLCSISRRTTPVGHLCRHPKSHHILAEKPLCTIVQDCRKVIDAARWRPAILIQVGLEYSCKSSSCDGFWMKFMTGMYQILLWMSCYVAVWWTILSGCVIHGTMENGKE